jgi:hypothetical protein
MTDPQNGKLDPQYDQFRRFSATFFGSHEESRVTRLFTTVKTLTPGATSKPSRYGWHFPEMGKIVTENLAYAKALQGMPLLLKSCRWLIRLSHEK